MDGGLQVVLDLARDTRAREDDALYVLTTLRDAGVDAVAYPWEPSVDVLTPLGAVRPLQVLVRSADVEQAVALVHDVLADSADRSEVLVPLADAWVLPYYVGVVSQHIRRRAIEDGGLWELPFLGLQLYVLWVIGWLGFNTLALLSMRGR